MLMSVWILLQTEMHSEKRKLFVKSVAELHDYVRILTLMPNYYKKCGLSIYI